MIENFHDVLVKRALNQPTTSLVADDLLHTKLEPCMRVRDCWSSNTLPLVEQTSPRRIGDAVALAGESFRLGDWARYSKYERRSFLLAWANLIEQNAKSLAFLNCLETGRSLKSLEADSVPKAVRALRWFAELVDKLDDRSIHSGEFGADVAIVRREPLGVVVAILPWNDPMVTFVWKVAPALAMGNSVIVKPSEYATLVLIEAARLAHQAGIPIRALQVVTGDGEVGRELVRQSAVEKIAFTGSSITAASIGMDAHRAGIKRLSFECGGKGHFIYGRHARNIDVFSKVVAQNMFYNQGQICSAPSVVHVPRKQADAFVDCVTDVAKDYMPSHPIDGGDVGLMVSREAVSRVRATLATVAKDCFVGSCGEHIVSPEFPERSIAPTVLLGPSDQHPIWDTELFAPVLLVRPYDDIQEALAHAAASRYGLAAGIWSYDIDEALRLAAQLRVGNVHVNSWGDDPNQVPFGGMKESGHGREKSIDAFDSYSQLKSIFYRPQLG